MSTERDPLGRNWRLWGGILAFIVVLVVLGFFFAPKPPPTTFPTGSPTPTATTGPPVTNPTPSAPPTPVSGECPALSTDATFPGTSPATQWKRHPAGMLLPVSTEHGAAKTDGAFWRCFSHTPTGAVFAAITLSFDISSGGVIDAAVESKERDTLFEDWKKAPTPNEYPVVSAFRVMNSSTSKASIEYLTTYGEQYAAVRFDVLWDAAMADWRLDLSGGDPQWKTISDPTGFTSWK